MGTTKLIDALNDGKILCKVHYDDENCIEFAFQVEYNGIRNLELKGWGTAHGGSMERLLDMFQYPTNWKVVKDFNMNTDDYPYPWSSSNKTVVEYE